MTEILEYLYHYSNIDFRHKMYHNKNSKYYIVQKKKTILYSRVGKYIVAFGSQFCVCTQQYTPEINFESVPVVNNATVRPRRKEITGSLTKRNHLADDCTKG